MLRSYEIASGQKSNLGKSSFIISKYASIHHIRWLKVHTGISPGILPFQYLGHVLYKGRRLKIYFQHLVDKFQHKLMGWRGRLLSPGGRIVLIRHVLSSIPPYTFSAAAPPKGIIQQLERICSRFLWTGDHLEQKRTWRSWQHITGPVQENGLGFRSFEDVLFAYSCKLWWKCRTGVGLWATYVNRVSWRKSVAKHRLFAVDDFMRARVHVVVGLGACSLLFDNWSGKGALVDLFNLSDMESLRSLCVKDVLVHGS